MSIRHAVPADIDKINEIYCNARKYMQDNGNPNQWDDGYPDEETIKDDILKEQSYLIEENGEVLGVFAFIIGEDPTYKIIEQGEWRSDKPYGTIHRIASSGKGKGLARKCFDFCAGEIDYLRIDTHENNKSMQNAIYGYGFEKCGVIQVRNGARVAFDYFVEP